MYGIFMSETFHKIQKMADIPSDVALKVPIITLIGHQELTIENYRGIIEYRDNLIRVQTKTEQIKICGTHLDIEYYTNDEMKINGEIGTIECHCLNEVPL